MSQPTSTVRTGKIDVSQSIRFSQLPKSYQDLVVDASANQDTLMPTSEEILERGLDWNNILGAFGGDFLKEHLEVIRKFDHKRIDSVALAAKYRTYPGAFLTVLGKIQSAEVRQYLMALLDRLLNEVPNFAEDLWSLHGTRVSDTLPLPLGPLLALLRSQADDLRKTSAPLTGEDPNTRYRRALYICSRTCAIITSLFIKVKIPVEDQQVFIPWLKLQCEKEPVAEKMIGLQSLQELLTVNEYKVIFWHQQGVEVLQQLVKAPAQGEGPKNIQQLYLAVKCLWLLSYNEEIRATLTSPVMILNLVEILKYVAKDKVLRLTLGTLRNLLNVDRNDELMISYGIIRCLQLFAQKKWADEDIEADLQHLQEALEAKVNDLTSYDVYYNELLSLKLDWSSPVHRSERFWRSNINRFDDNDYAPLKKLREILVSPESSPSVLAVACWDVGEIIRQHPQRSFVLKQVDLKTPVMTLLHHENPDVKKEALLAVQKIMVIHWEGLQ